MPLELLLAAEGKEENDVPAVIRRLVEQLSQRTCTVLACLLTSLDSTVTGKFAALPSA